MKIYVELTSQPIGIINATTDENEEKEEKEEKEGIIFVKPENGIFNKVLLIVFFDNTYGIIIEKKGSNLISIEKLPEILLERYNNAHIVKKQNIPIVETKVPIIIGQNPVMLHKTDLPLIVESKEEEQPIRKRPLITRRNYVPHQVS